MFCHLSIGASARLLVSALMVMTIAGCQNGPQATTDRADPLTAPDGSTMSYETLAATHNERLGQYRTVNARGNIELRWRDERGRHFEQGDLDFFLEQPNRTAFRISKLGEIYFWVGSGDQCIWFFDLSADPRRLTVDSIAAEWAAEEEGAAFRPLSVLDLMALSRLPEIGSDRDAPTVYYDDQRDAWRVTVEGQGGPVRLFFDRATRQPIRAEGLDENGRPMMQSVIGRFRPVDQPTGRAGGVIRPLMPTLVDIEPMDERVGSMQIKIALGSPTADVDRSVLDRIFDLERLVGSLRPELIEGEPVCLELIGR